MGRSRHQSSSRASSLSVPPRALPTRAWGSHDGSAPQFRPYVLRLGAPFRTTEGAGPMSTVFVVGSLNIDQNIRVSALPRAGETVRGSDATYSPGGKGGNQAVAAARAGAAVKFTGAVGDDAHGRRILEVLAEAGIDPGHVRVSGTAATGTAVIAGVDLLVVNEQEIRVLADLAGVAGIQGNHRDLVTSLPPVLGPAILCTAGAEGSFTVVDGSPVHVPATKVDARDTTGAGDTFVGYLAASLAGSDRELPAAMLHATRA